MLNAAGLKLGKKRPRLGRRRSEGVVVRREKRQWKGEEGGVHRVHCVYASLHPEEAFWRWVWRWLLAVVCPTGVYWTLVFGGVWWSSAALACPAWPKDCHISSGKELQVSGALWIFPVSCTPWAAVNCPLTCMAACVCIGRCITVGNFHNILFVPLSTCMSTY